MTTPLELLIAQQAPMTVHDYMQLCLQHPQYGYYRQAKAVGREGDFTTAPEISQIFGDIIGFYFRHFWQQSGEADFHWVELGPGRGTLSADCLRHLPACAVHLLESNRTLRKVQEKTLCRYQPCWHDDVDALPKDKPLYLVANEFLDALPIRQWVGEEERQVICRDGKLYFHPEGKVTREQCPQAEQLLLTIIQRLKKQGGVAMLIDYGYVQGQGDSLQAVKQHTYCDPLHTPGEADLTAHVNFGALQQIALEHAAEVTFFDNQAAFLRQHGGEIWLQKLLLNSTQIQLQRDLQEGWLRLISPSQMGELFKVMVITA